MFIYQKLETFIFFANTYWPAQNRNQSVCKFFSSVKVFGVIILLTMFKRLSLNNLNPVSSIKKGFQVYYNIWVDHLKYFSIG